MQVTTQGARYTDSFTQYVKLFLVTMLQQTQNILNTNFKVELDTHFNSTGTLEVMLWFFAPFY